jgi:hypothetical protein
LPVPELVQEVRLETNENAEYGDDFGTTFEVVTKSGTNQFHGNVYEYARNSAFDARNFFAPSVSPENQQDFGAILGGPIQKDKTFFMVNYSGYRIRSALAGQILTVPTESMRNGDFSALLGSEVGTNTLGQPVYSGEIFNPATTQPDGQGGYTREAFPGNIIPQADFSRISKYFASQYPLPNQPGTELNYDALTAPLDYPQKDQGMVRIDHDFGSSQKLSIGGDYAPRYDTSACSDIFSDAYQGFGAPVNNCTNVTGVVGHFHFNYAWSLSPNLLLSFDGGSTFSEFTARPPTSATDVAGMLGLKGVYGPGLPAITITGEQGLGFVDQGYHRWFVVVPFDAVVTWVKGDHQTKFGFQFLESAATLNIGFYTAGDFCFVPQETDLPDFTGPSGTTGLGFASFLLGQVNSATVENQMDQRWTAPAYGIYGQDQWRVSPKLTLNYGLRWDINEAPAEEHDRMGDFCPSCPNPAAGGRLGALTFWGSGPDSNGLTRGFNTYLGGLGPRLGIAYQVNPKTVVRSYFGVFYFPMGGIMSNGRWFPNYGWGATLTAASTNNGVTPLFNNWDNGTFTLPAIPDFNPSLLNGSGLAYWNPNDDKPGVVEARGFTLERELGRGLVARAEYAGKFETNLPTNNLVDLNQLPLKDLSLGSTLLDDVGSPQAQAAGITAPYPGFTGTVAQALTPYPQYEYINEISAFAKTVWWDAGIFEVQKHFGNGLSLLGTYTIQKMLSNDPFPICTASVCASIPESVQTSALRNVTGKGLVTASEEGGDRPQTLNLNFTYELPFGEGKRFLRTSSKLVNDLAGGWAISGVQAYMSGVPVSVSTEASIPTYGPIWADRNPSGGAIRGNASCSNYNPNNPASLYLNLNAFVSPPSLALGTVDDLSNVRTCGYMNEDLSVLKTFQIGERFQAKLGADIDNVFNRVNWIGLQTNINIPSSYGRYSGADDPREIELHLDLNF